MPNPEATPYPVRGMDRGGASLHHLTTLRTRSLIILFRMPWNVIFKKVEKLPLPLVGFLFAPALDSRFMHSDEYFQRNGSEFLLAVSLVATYLYTAGVGPFTSIQDTPFTGDIDQFFDSDTGFDTFFLTNGLDPVRQWNGTGTISVVPGLTSVEGGFTNVTGNLIRSFSGFMILLSTTETGNPYPQRVRWCVFGQPGNWTNDINGNGQAGSNDLADDVGFILWATVFNNYLCIYKERSIYLMQYVGPPTIFSFQRVINGVGLLAQRSVADLGDEHAFLGNDNFYTFNGISIDPIGNAIKNYFFSDLDPGYRNRVQAFVVEEDDEVWWVYASGATTYSDGTPHAPGDPDKAVVWNYLNNTWAIRDNPGTYWFYYQHLIQNTWQTVPDLSWAATAGNWNDKRFTANFPLNLSGMVDGSVVQYGGVYDKLGIPFTKSLQTKFLDFGKPGIKNDYLMSTCNVLLGTLERSLARLATVKTLEMWFNGRRRK